MHLLKKHGTHILAAKNPDIFHKLFSFIFSTDNNCTSFKTEEVLQYT